MTCIPPVLSCSQQQAPPPPTPPVQNIQQQQQSSLLAKSSLAELELIRPDFFGRLFCVASMRKPHLKWMDPLIVHCINLDGIIHGFALVVFACWRLSQNKWPYQPESNGDGREGICKETTSHCSVLLQSSIFALFSHSLSVVCKFSRKSRNGKAT